MRRVTIFISENVTLSSIGIPLDVFNATGVFWNMLNESEPTPFFDVRTASIDGNPIKTYFGHEIKPDLSIQDAGGSDTIIIPPADATDILAPEVISWLIESHKRGAHIASVCLGAFLLAQTGLLDNKRATTHWGYENLFRKQFPRVKLEPEKLITDEGDLFTSGGANAGGDLALYLIAKYAGKEAAYQTARIMVMDADRVSQSPYSTFRFDKSHGDTQILDIQLWLEQNFNKDVTVNQLAEKAGMSRRTFERRFKDITGDSPRRCIQRIRVEKAKQFLEMGGKTFDEITCLVGYEDSSTFSRVFKKSTGLSPNLYKRKYSKAC